MDGILDELLRLEDAKRDALIGFDPAAYDRSVRSQLFLLEDGRLPPEARSAADKLRAFSRLSELNTALYRNLLTTAPWVTAANRSYTGEGRPAESGAPRTFSAEA